MGCIISVLDSAGLDSCESMCGPWISSTGITWENFRNAKSKAPSQIC